MTGVLMSPLLKLAIRTGSIPGVKARLLAGEPVDARDGDGLTALMFAASRGFRSLCEFLLDSGADPAATTPDGTLAADWARSGGHDALADWLLGLVAAVNERAGHYESGTAAGEASPVDAALLERTAQAPDERVIDVAVDGPLFGDDDWETEEAPTVGPVEDTGLREAAVELQRAIAVHETVDQDESWDEVEPELPEENDPVEVEEPARGPDAEIVRTIGLLLDECYRRGSVSSTDAEEMLLAVASSRDDEGLARHVLRTLSEYGVLIEDVPVGLEAPNDVRSLEFLIDEGADASTNATEAAEFTLSAASESDSPIWQWLRDIRRAGPVLDAEQERRLGVQIRDSLRSGLRELVKHEAGRSAITSFAQQIAEGHGGKHPETDTDTDTPPTAIEELQQSGQAGSVRSDLAEMISSLRSGTWRMEKVVAVMDREIRRHRGGLGNLDRLIEAAFVAGLDKATVANARAAARELMAAASALTERNLRLVWTIARKTHRNGLPLEDLVQEGSIGLMRAVAGYDPDRGFRFSTYATWWIRQGVHRAVDNQADLIRVPVHMQETIRTVETAEFELSHALPRDPTPADIAARTKLSSAVIDRALKIRDPIVWTDGLPDAGESLASLPGESPLPDEEMASTEAGEIVRRALCRLKKKEALVVAMRSGIGNGREYTLEEVGQTLDVTRERIRQIESKAMARLKEIVESIIDGEAEASHLAATIPGRYPITPRGVPSTQRSSDLGAGSASMGTAAVRGLTDKQRQEHERAARTIEALRAARQVSSREHTALPSGPGIETVSETGAPQVIVDGDTFRTSLGKPIVAKNSAEREISTEVRTESKPATQSAEKTRHDVIESLRLLSSPLKQWGLLAQHGYECPHHEFAKQWFQRYSTVDTEGAFSAVQHGELQAVSAALRQCVRKLGSGARRLDALLSTTEWEAVIRAARVALEDLVPPAKGRRA